MLPTAKFYSGSRFSHAIKKYSLRKRRAGGDARRFGGPRKLGLIMFKLFEVLEQCHTRSGRQYGWELPGVTSHSPRSRILAHLVSEENIRKRF
jgi:hypothetical protein